MRSTGEVMGIDVTFGLAFAKSQMAAGNPLPAAGTVFLSLADRDKAAGAAGGPAVRRARASRSWPPRAPPRTSRPTACRSTRWWPSSAARAGEPARRVDGEARGQGSTRSS